MANCIIKSIAAKQATKFAIADTKFYLSVVTYSTENNEKLLQQFKSGFKRTINWNKYQSKVTTQAQNQYLDYLINSSFQGVYRGFVLSYENIRQETGCKWYFLSTVETKDCNVMIDGRNFFDQPMKNDGTHDNIQKIATYQDYTTSCFKDYTNY